MEEMREEIRLSDILLLIWRRKLVLIVCVVFFVAIALFWGFFLVEYDYQITVPLRLDHSEYNVEPHRSGHIKDFFREGRREIQEIDEEITDNVIETTLEDKDLPPYTVSVIREEVILTFTTDTPGEFREEEIPGLVEELNRALEEYYGEFVGRMKERRLMMIDLEVQTLRGQLDRLENELMQLEEDEGFFVEKPVEDHEINPLYQEFSARKGDVTSMKLQLQQEQQELEALTVEEYFAASTLEEAGVPETTSQAPRRVIVTGIAGVFGVFVGLFLIYLLSMGDLKQMVQRREEKSS